ncbi:hypothetical protein RYH80_01790 [Halobaculum sp. MBLA0147]|uniref:hypothetical protein n=1 Tax=Halobaculum sp. MBLA0147 TaxID=3079934 RepID=UPI0035263029
MERNVVDEFSGLRRFQQDETLDIVPIIEIIEESDLDNLEVYAQAGTPVLVDVPEYLTETEEPNGFTAEVEELLSDFDTPVKFFNKKSDYIGVPVVSGHLNDQFNYSVLFNRYRNLSDDFNRVAIRVFIGSSELTTKQNKDLRELRDTISNEDILLLDSIEPAELGPESTARKNLTEVAEMFDSNERIILDAFSVFRGVNYNFGPAIAREAGVSGFGDFAHDRRLPPAEDIPMGMHNTRNIYHYDYEDRQQRKFQGNDGYSGQDSAFEALSDWDKWSPDHCEFCEEAEARDSEGPTFWKRVRMGHYVESVVETES